MVERIQRKPELSESKRRAKLMSSVRNRMLRIPDTNISHTQAAPRDIFLSLHFHNEKGQFVKIGWSKDRLAGTINNIDGGTESTFMLVEGNTYYVNWDIEEFGQDADGLRIIEEKINRFLPPQTL